VIDAVFFMHDIGVPIGDREGRKFESCRPDKREIKTASEDAVFFI